MIEAHLEPDVIPGSGTLDPDRIALLRSKPSAAGGSLFDRVVTVYLENSRKLVGSLERAANDDDVDEFRSLAQALKASSGNVGAMRVSRACAAVEHADDAILSDEADALLERIRDEHDAALRALSAEASGENVA